MKEQTSTILQNPRTALPEKLSDAVAPVIAQLGETVSGVRTGPTKPAGEFLDIEAVRLRVAQGQRGRPLPGQANLVERLRMLPLEQPITYVILETTARQAKCYVDVNTRQLLGVLWLPAGPATELENGS